MEIKDYPQHLSNPLRIEIASMLIQHELRKLFPHVRDQEIWKELDTQVRDWPKDASILRPVHDFWNVAHAFCMGVRLKALVYWITSENINWQRERLSIEHLYFGVKLESISFAEDQPNAGDIRRYFYQEQNKKQLEELREKSDAESKKTSHRDNDPIIVQEREGKLIILDGNRRVLRAIAKDKPLIAAYVARTKHEPLLHDHWVPTSTMHEIMSAHRYACRQDPHDSELLTSTFAKTLASMIKDSVIAQTMFVERVKIIDATETDTLYKAVSKILQEKNVSLPQL